MNKKEEKADFSVIDFGEEAADEQAVTRNDRLAEEYKALHPEQTSPLSPEQIPEKIDAEYLKEMGQTVNLADLYEAIQEKRDYNLDVDYETFQNVVKEASQPAAPEIKEPESAYKPTGRYQKRKQQQEEKTVLGDFAFNEILDTVRLDEDQKAAEMKIEDLNHWDPSQDGKKKARMNPAVKEALSWILTCLIAVGIALLLKKYVVITANVPTGSMENTILPGDNLVGYRLAYVNSDPQRGDIVIFYNPDDASEKYIKRIIGLPGETVTIENSVVYINGEALQEDYLKEKWIYYNDGYTFEIPENCYLMMGDNRNNSKDARLWDNTYVSKDMIIGKALWVYWPLSDWGTLADTPDYNVD